ncbi:MAG: glycoside hydrolase family 38 C-terminal domain-containing protein, partial [Bacteroidota bacterium]|nr:glycoside hydrolase family 38 C-terminal domain-containing protein [Bacteroidota bacterium]
MPQIHLIGNAHLDPAWMWRMEEGLAAFRATCRSALDRIREFPGFIFTCSSAAHFAFVEETDPDLFGRIQQAVCDGRWAIVGGWWVEPDCNLPSGESFIRQALLGQEYFQRRFGKIATVAYNIDSFGHNANLPQLLRKAGLTSYVFMRPGEEEKPLPASLFQWEAPSGDRVTAYRLPLHYSNYEFSTREKLHRLPDYPLYTPEPPWMIFFGVGNHGGGPTIAELEDIADLRKEQRGIELSEPERFFAAIDCTTLPVVHDEIQPHAIGCYSAHSEIKQLHRRTEHALLTAERAQVLGFLFEYLLGSQASLIMREDLRLDKTEDSPAFSRRGQGVVELDRAWKNLCFNQFHDLLGGVAIREACDDSISMYREAISVADRITRDKLGSLMARIDMSAHIENLVVFNLSAHPRKELIEFECWLPHESGQKPLPEVRLISPDGKAVPSQRIEASGKIGDDRMRYAAIVSVPAFGWSVFGIERSNSVSVTDVSEITLPVEYAPAVIVRDESDTWGHGATSFTDYESEFRIDAIETIEHGPLRTGCRIKSSGGASRMEEEILWTKDDPAIEIRVFLDWHERHRILKIRFRHGCADP